MAGVQEQDAPRQWLEILKSVEVQRDEPQVATLLPADQASFSVAIKFDSSVIAEQSYDLAVSASFKGEVSRARTFGFLAEVEQLRKMGLARGGSLHNAIVISDDKVLNEGGLRYSDEFARHKLLDAIGDLSLAGAPILGAFNAFCTGHALNNKLLHALFADRSAWRLAPALTQWQWPIWQRNSLPSHERRATVLRRNKLNPSWALATALCCQPAQRLPIQSNLALSTRSC